MPNAPTWLIPSAPGQLSNKRATNSGDDAIALSARYSGATSGSDGIGTIRCTASRIARGGSNQSPQTVWDSGWTGTPSTSTIPLAARLEGHQVVVYGGRVYLYYTLISSGDVFISAPVSGASHGRWRFEAPIVVSGTSYGCDGMVEVNGYLYATRTDASGNSTGEVWYAQIQGDGTIAGWVQTNGFTTPLAGGYTLFGYGDSTNAFLMALGGGRASVWRAAILADRTTDVWSLSGNSLPGTRNYSRVIYDHSTTKLYVIGGDDGTNAQSNIYQCVITEAGGGNGAFGTTISGLPAARCAGGCCVAADSTGVKWVYYIGGSSAKGSTPAGVTTVYFQLLSTLQTGSWTTAGNALPGAAFFQVAYVPGKQYDTINGLSDWLAYSAGSQGGSNSSATRVASIDTSGQPGDFTTTGAASGLTATQLGRLGDPGTITNNVSFTEDATWKYGRFGASAIVKSFHKPDVVEFSVQFTGAATGDPSPVAYTGIKIGQPPTVNTIVITPSTDGEPIISFTYNPGAGGAAQKAWRVQIYPVMPAQPVQVVQHRFVMASQRSRASGVATQSLQGKAYRGPSLIRVASHAQSAPKAIASTSVDSGIVVGNVNTYQAAPAPTFAPNAQLQVVVTVYANDVATAGSQAFGVSGAVFTPSGTAPGVPTTVTATADNTNCWIALTWTSASDTNPTPQVNRIYYRKSGTTSWTLLRDNLGASGPGGQTTVYLMDDLKIDGTSYDFYVSALSSDHIESAQPASAQATAAIQPNYQWPDGFVAMIHIAGSQGPTSHMGLFLVGPPVITRNQDTPAELYFGDQKVRYRYGIENYRVIKLPVSNTFARMSSLDDLLALVYAGATLCYRDYGGNVIYCGFHGERGRTWDLYGDEGLILTEVQYTVVV